MFLYILFRPHRIFSSYSSAEKLVIQLLRFIEIRKKEKKEEWGLVAIEIVSINLSCWLKCRLGPSRMHQLLRIWYVWVVFMRRIYSQLDMYDGLMTAENKNRPAREDGEHFGACWQRPKKRSCVFPLPQKQDMLAESNESRFILSSFSYQTSHLGLVAVKKMRQEMQRARERKPTPSRPAA